MIKSEHCLKMYLAEEHEQVSKTEQRKQSFVIYIYVFYFAGSMCFTKTRSSVGASYLTHTPPSLYDIIILYMYNCLCNQNIFATKNYRECGLFTKFTKIIVPKILWCTVDSMPRLLPVLFRSRWSTATIPLFISIYLLVEQSALLKEFLCSNRAVV